MSRCTLKGKCGKDDNVFPQTVLRNAQEQLKSKRREGRKYRSQKVKPKWKDSRECEGNTVSDDTHL